MNPAPRDDAARRTFGVLCVAAVWSAYLPLGAKYACTLTCATAAVALLARRDGWNEMLHDPTARATAALLAWLALSAAWSRASWSTMASHWGQYALLLLVPLIGHACPPSLARRALAHFAVSSALVAVAFLLAATVTLPPSDRLWHTTLAAEGNQRIATSMLLAWGCAASIWLGTSRASTRAPALWWAVAATCLLGLGLQDRRSGMVLLPMVLLAWAWVSQPRGPLRLASVLLVVVAAAAAGWGSDGVRARFAEGWAEIRKYQSSDETASSWGQRLRMWQLTAAMVAERPLLGHGLASWKLLWRERVTPGTALAENSTPHNEYLLLAEQAGVVAVGLWAWVVIVSLRRAARAGPAGAPAVMAWTAIAGMALFNAALRDAKFALPLLLLAALSTALARSSDPPPTPDSRRRQA